MLQLKTVTSGQHSQVGQGSSPLAPTLQTWERLMVTRTARLGVIYGLALFF